MQTNKISLQQVKVFISVRDSGRWITRILRERPRRLRRGGIAHRAKRGQTPVDLTLMLLCEYNRQYENRTANQVAPG